VTRQVTDRSTDPPQVRLLGVQDVGDDGIAFAATAALIRT